MRREFAFAQRVSITECKRRAKLLLDRDNHRLWLIVAGMLWLATAGAIYLLGAGLVYAADASVFTDQPSDFATVLILLSYGLMLLMTVFVLLPMSAGVMLVSQRICQGKTVDGNDLFAAFSSAAQYGVCLKVAFFTLLRPLWIALIAFLTGVTAGNMLHELLLDAGAISVLAGLARVGMALLAIVLAICLAIGCRSSFLVGVLMLRGTGFWKAKRQVKAMCKKHGARLLGYRAIFALQMILSAFTVGVSALVHTVPLTLLCNQIICDELIKSSNKSNEN